MTGHILSSVENQVGYLQIARPEKRNAITLEMWNELTDQLQRLMAASVRAIVIAGVPGNFVSGADILEFDHTKSSPEAARRSFLAVDEFCRALYEAPVLVLAAIDGFAIGAGLELAVSCDIRLATGSSKLGITAAKLGITIGRAHIRRLMAVVGAAHALDLLTTGRLITADESYHMGLVTEVVPDGKLAERVDAWVDRYRRRAPLSLTWAKEAVHRISADPNLGWVRDDAGESIGCFETDDFREAVRAFREHRTPTFHGNQGGKDR